MKKQLCQIGSALGAFVALAYLAYALTYTLRIGGAYVLGAPAADEAQHAQRQQTPREPAKPEQSSTTPSSAETMKPDTWEPNRNGDPIPSQAEPPAVQTPPPVFLPESGSGTAIAGNPRVDDAEEEAQGANTATVAYRGPTYDEMRSKLEHVRRSSTMGGRR